MRAMPGPLVGSALILALLVQGPTLHASDNTLIEAVRARDIDTVQALLKQQVDVNAPEPDGATALHWAAYEDDLSLARLLTDAGAAVDAVNDYGVTPLSLACDNGAAAMVTLLLEAGADPEVARTTGETPLMTCARTGDVDAVRALLSHGADPNIAESWNDQTALMWAVGEGHTKVARVLVEHGADVQARSTGGFTALLIAARVDDRRLADWLIDAGADVNDAAPDGTTPLMVATIRGHVPLAIFLLERGADPNTTELGFTPLHWAAGSWHTELTGSLRGMNPDRDDEWRFLNGFRTGTLDLVRSLLEHGADPHARLTKLPPSYGFSSSRFKVSLIGATPFLLAAMDGNVEVMAALDEVGADVYVGTDENTTPLMVAAGLGQVPAETRVTATQSFDAVEYLLERGAYVNAVNARGRTALHGAAHIRSDAIVQLLADHGASLNVADEKGITPLMIAEGGGHVLLPGLGGGSTADLLRALGGTETTSDLIQIYDEGKIR